MRSFFFILVHNEQREAAAGQPVQGEEATTCFRKDLQGADDEEHPSVFEASRVNYYYFFVLLFLTKAIYNKYERKQRDRNIKGGKSIDCRGILFAFVFPLVQVTLFFYAIGRDPKGIVVAIVNDEAGNCDNGNLIGSVIHNPEDGTCDYIDISCRFLNGFNSSIMEKV